MATTNIELDIENITGVADANAQFLISAQKFVVASIPKDLLWFASTSSTAPDGNGIDIQSSDGVLSVDRNGYPSFEVPFSMSKWIDDNSSLQKATALHPKHYDKGGKIYIKPDPDSSNTGTVQYVDYSQIGDDCDLRNAVIFHASSSEFTKLATGQVPSWTTISSPVAPSSPDFGSDLTISASSPVSPSLSSNSVSFSETAPEYTKPIVSLTSFPSITWSFGAVPIAPSLSSTTVSFEQPAPSFTPPVMSSPDWTDTEDLITNEEDSEMLSSRVSEINAKISEYNSKLQESQAVFNKENAEYQAQLQISLQNAQQENADDAQKIQKFQSEVASYQAEVATTIQSNQGEIAEWQNKNAMEIQKYGTDIQNELNSFNKSNVEYQANLQVALQDAQLSSQDDAQLLQKYSGEIQDYQADVAKEVQDYTNTLQKEIQEYQNNIALFGAKVQNFQSELAEKTQESNLKIQNTQHYANESKKYYEWAKLEINSFIQNNSKIINKTIAAQAAQR